MTTLVGVTLLALVLVTMLVLLGVWRWLHKPTVSDESLEALWSIVLSLHETTQRLEVAAERLERLLAQANGKRFASIERERLETKGEGGGDRR